jgi:hypothetical protein
MKTPWHVWVVGALLLFWNGFGMVDFAATVTRFEPYLASYPKALLDYTYSLPSWLFAVWGGALLAGLLGALFLLLRNKLAVPALIVCGIGPIVSMAMSYVFPPPPIMDRTMPWLILAIGVLSPIYALWLQKRGVLR